MFTLMALGLVGVVGNMLPDATEQPKPGTRMERNQGAPHTKEPRTVTIERDEEPKKASKPRTKEYTKEQLAPYMPPAEPLKKPREHTSTAKDKVWLDELAGELIWFPSIVGVTEPMKDQEGKWFVTVSYESGATMDQYVEKGTPKEVANEIGA